VNLSKFFVYLVTKINERVESTYLVTELNDYKVFRVRFWCGNSRFYLSDKLGEGEKRREGDLAKGRQGDPESLPVNSRDTSFSGGDWAIPNPDSEAFTILDCSD